MKTIRNSIFYLTILLLMAPMLRAQDLSKYRVFSLGTSLATVLKHTDQQVIEVKVLHQHPALIQELTWWPPAIPGSVHRSDTVQQMLFSFYNGELYKISVIYEPSAIEGLTTDDMVQSISATYGPPIKTATESKLPASEHGYSNKTTVAQWENSEFSLRLIRSSSSDEFGLLMFSKRVNGQAAIAIAEAVNLEEQERPRKEAERQQKEVNDLEAAREKNRKSFQP